MKKLLLVLGCIIVAIFASCGYTIEHADAIDNSVIISDGDYYDIDLKTRIIPIGDWNMTVTPVIIKTHGLTFSKIRLVTASIKVDNDTGIIPFCFGYNYTGIKVAYGGIIEVTATDINLNNEAGTNRFFKGEFFDQTNYNRGWVTIWYEE
jgi:hypothetical protein